MSEQVKPLLLTNTNNGFTINSFSDTLMYLTEFKEQVNSKIHVMPDWIKEIPFNQTACLSSDLSKEIDKLIIHFDKILKDEHSSRNQFSVDLSEVSSTKNNFTTGLYTEEVDESDCTRRKLTSEVETLLDSANRTIQRLEEIEVVLRKEQHKATLTRDVLIHLTVSTQRTGNDEISKVNLPATLNTSKNA